MKLFDEEEDWSYPPIVIMMDLEGIIYLYKYFETKWEHKDEKTNALLRNNKILVEP